jgi:hypothetical protein
MTNNNIPTAAGLANCENRNCGKPLKPPYYLNYSLTTIVREYITVDAERYKTHFKLVICQNLVNRIFLLLCLCCYKLK